MVLKLKLEKYKKALTLLLVISLILLIAWVAGKQPSKEASPAPVIKKDLQNRQKEMSPNKPEGLVLEQAYPKSGNKESKKSDNIVLVFNKPVDISTIEYTVSPFISLAFRTYGEDKKTVSVFPDKRIWIARTNYLIRITKLKGLEGNLSLGEPINYLYYYDYPNEPMGGESWKLD